MATLFSPTGDKYETSDQSEITRLRVAHGYSDKKPTPTQIAVHTGEKPPKPTT